MKRLLAIALLLAACVDHDPNIAGDIVKSLTFTEVDKKVADGESHARVTVATEDVDRLDPSLTALLHLSDGVWLDKADSGDAHALTVPMKATSVAREMILPTNAGTISVSATIAGFEVVSDLKLIGAPVSKVDAVATGVFPAPTATSGTAINLSALLEMASPAGARPTVGTPVDFKVDVVPESKGYPMQQTVLVTNSPTVTATYIVLPGAQSLTLTVTARADGQVEVAGTAHLSP